MLDLSFLGQGKNVNEKVFLGKNPDRKKSTFLCIILTYFKPGTIVLTDCFNIYSNFYYHSIKFNDSAS
ncbi:hypothetical protein HZS_4834 [Henneguya salminicola]|nr:hypothetical protein HZS_4834 [Henneguya salminicola]